MVDGEARETDDVDNLGTILLDVGKQLIGGAPLVAASERKNGSPVAALEVALPRAAAFALKDFSVITAESAEIWVAGDHDFIAVGRRFSRAVGENATNDRRVVCCFWQCGIEARMIEELPGSANDDETMMAVCRRRFAFGSDDFLRNGIEAIFPDELVGVRESVSLKIEGTAGRGLGTGAAHCDEQGTQQ